MDTDCEFVLLGPGDVVINITNNNLECLPDLNTYLCDEGRESSREMEEVDSSKRRSREDGRVEERLVEPPIFRAKRGRPCSEPPTREVVTKRRKVHKCQLWGVVIVVVDIIAVPIFTNIHAFFLLTWRILTIIDMAMMGMISTHTRQRTPARGKELTK